MSGKYNRKDHFYNKAKEEGFKSRAAYKLKELDDKFKILKRGYKVIDLGAWPGGWLQIAADKVGHDGVVVGVDLATFDPFSEPNIKTITGDVRDLPQILEPIGLAGDKFDVVLSDMSPKLSGIREVDNAACSGCAELALYTAQNMLKAGGTLIIKLFKSNEAEQFVKSSRPLFNKVQRVELDSTRNSSNEYYFVGLGLKAGN